MEAVELKALVEQLPPADGAGTYNANIDKDKIDKTIAEIHKGGKASVLGIIEMLTETKDVGQQVTDVKPHYALHCLINHVLIIKDEKARKEYCETIAGEIGGKRPKGVQAYLCEQLQWGGRKESVAALGKVLNDAELSAPAAMALVAIKDGAAEQFQAVLPNAKGAAKLNIVQGLGAVGDKESIPAFKKLLADEDREIRLAAGWSLARMGDAGSVDVIIKAAEVPDGWERIQATKHCLVLAEKLNAAGKSAGAKKIYEHLRDSRKGEHEQYIREAAEKALAGGKT